MRIYHVPEDHVFDSGDDFDKSPFSDQAATLLVHRCDYAELQIENQKLKEEREAILDAHKKQEDFLKDKLLVDNKEMKEKLEKACDEVCKAVNSLSGIDPANTPAIERLQKLYVELGE